MGSDLLGNQANDKRVVVELAGVLATQEYQDHGFSVENFPFAQ